MTTNHDEKDAKKSKLSVGLKKLSAEQLGELHDAISAELKRRAQDKADRKPLSKMSDREFETFVAKAISKGDHDDE